MGQQQCCLGPSTAEKQPRNAVKKPKHNVRRSSSDSRGESSIMTLEDVLINSPALNSHSIMASEISVLKQCHPSSSSSSPGLDNARFYTPRTSVDEFGGADDVSEKSILRRGGSSGKKTVRFMLPEEVVDHVIVFYSPQETFHSIIDYDSNNGS